LHEELLWNQLKARGLSASNKLLHFTWVAAESKCILVMHVCLSVHLSALAFQHYCTDPGVSWGNGNGCPLVVHYWLDLQSVHRFHCYDNIVPNAKCQRVLILALWLVMFIFITTTLRAHIYLLPVLIQTWYFLCSLQQKAIINNATLQCRPICWRPWQLLCL